MCLEKQELYFSQYRLGNVVITNNAKMEVAQNNMFIFHSYFLDIEIQDPKLIEASLSVTPLVTTTEGTEDREYTLTVNSFSPDMTHINSIHISLARSSHMVMLNFNGKWNFPYKI